MKKIIVAILLTITIMPLSSQDMTSVFLNIPDNILFGLDAEAKDRLITNLEDTANVEVTGVLENNIKRIASSSDYLKLQTSEVGTIQIKLLPLVNDSKIISVISTVCGKACDSNIRFFTTNWVPLPNAQVLIPQAKMDWLIKPDTDFSDQTFINAYSALDMIPIQMEFNPDDLSLKISCDLAQYLSPQDFNKIKPYLVEAPKTLVWDKISYK